MESLLQDLRYAIRQLTKSPGFTAVAVVTLALGMGATSAIFTLLKRVVLDPLPYPAPQELVRLKSAVSGIGAGNEWEMSAGAFFYYHGKAHSVSSLALYSVFSPTLEGAGEPVRVPVARVTASMLPMLGGEMLDGRSLTVGDDQPGAPLVVVLSHGFWLRQFGGDPAVVGRILVLSGSSAEVVGILKPGTELPQEPGQVSALQVDLWMPMRLNPSGPFYNNHVLRAIARVAPGKRLADVQSELDQLTPGLVDAVPTAYSAAFMKSARFRTVAYPLGAYVVGGVARSLWVLFAAVALVLVVAYGNVTNLMLARIEARRRELAIRAALGSGRAAIARLFLAEGLLLAVAGSAIGMLVATWGVEILARLAPAGLPRIHELRVDSGVVLFSVVIALLIAAGLTLQPLMQRGRDTGSAALAEGGRSSTVGAGRQRVRSTLLVSQVALALVLVVGAGLLLRTLRALQAVDPGITPDGVLVVQLGLPQQRYDSLSKIWLFHDELAQRLQQLPGVTLVGSSWSLPFDGNYGCTVQAFEDGAVLERINANRTTLCADMVASTTPGYFAALRIPVLAGRVFTREDNDHPDVGAVVVSRTFAQRFWGDQDPIGRGVRPFGRSGPPWYRVVGVVGDVYANSVDEAPANAVYYPVTAIPNSPAWFPSGQYVIIRTTRQDPLSLLPEVSRRVHEMDPAIPVANAETMAAIVERSMGRVTFMMVLLATAAGAALLLAAIGLYGVVSYLVARRTTEIGVRVALGAVPSEIARLVVGGSFRLALMGVGIGVVLAAVGSQVLGGLLYGVRPGDPVSYIVGVVVLLVVTLLAAYLPAQRAARVDPLVALRSE